MDAAALRPAVDADGHIMESLAEMAEYAHPAVRELCLNPQTFFRTPFPTLDGVHWPKPSVFKAEHGVMGDQELASTHRKGSAEDWLEFLANANVEYAVMYTSEGLTVGQIREEEYAIAVCQAYNDYVADRATLPYLVKRVRPDAFAFSTDYPHEVDFRAVRKEIEAAHAQPDLTLDEKNKLLGDNARRFFRLD